MALQDQLKKINITGIVLKFYFRRKTIKKTLK